jgi:hypothetical protein
MMAVIRALSAEMLKLKRTLALRLAFIAPMAIVGLQFLVIFERGQEFYQPQVESPWVRFVQTVSIFWALLMLPLFVTLETALLGGLEHRGDNWKHIYALPLPRWAVYVAKQIAGMGLIGLSQCALMGFTVLGGILLWVLKPGLGFHTPIPWTRLLKIAGTVYPASWLIISLHTWVGIRWRNFVVAMTVGIVLTVSGMFIVSADWGSFYPWALPGQIVNGFSKEMPVPVPELMFGCIGGIVVAVAGCWEATRRDVL